MFAGTVVVILSGLRLADLRHRVWASWSNLMIGLGLALSSLCAGYSGLDRQLWNSLALGILVGLLSLWSILDTPDGRQPS